MSDFYKITKEQLRIIEHNVQMIAMERESINELCKQERADINYGFELGKIYSNMGNMHTDLLFMASEIRNEE